MPEYLAPGVYVEETSFRAKSIEGVSTSTAAFVGPTRKGPLFDISDPPRSDQFLRGVPEVITSELEFERVYGGLENLSFNSDGDSEPSEVNYLAHAVKAFFNNGGSRLYVARTFVPRTNLDGTVSDGIARSNFFVGQEDDDESDRARFVARMPGSGLNLTIKAYQKSRSASETSIESAPEGTLLSIGGDNPAQPAVLLGGIPPFRLDDGESLSITVNDGTEQSITFTGTNAEAIGNALTLTDGNLTIPADNSLRVTFGANGTEQVISLPASTISLTALAEQINTSLRGGYARIEGGNQLVIGCDLRGTDAQVTVAENGTIGFSTDTTSPLGNGNVANLDAVTVVEINAILENANIDVEATLALSTGNLNLRTTEAPTSGAPSLQVGNNSLGLPTEISEGKEGEQIAYYYKQDGQWLGSNGSEVEPELLSSPTSKKFFVTLTLEIEDADGNQSIYEDIGFDRKHPLWVGEILKETPPRRLEALLNPCFLEIGDNVSAFDLREGLFGSSGENTISVSGGNDGAEPTASSTVDNAVSYEDGLSLLEAIENISIFAAPGHSDYTEFTTIQDLLIGHARRMKYRIAVLDTPSEQTVSGARETRSRVDSSYAALYYPWIVIANPLARPGNERIPREISVPPSGFVAGIYARTDIQRGVWKAPANEVVLGVQRFESEINFGQQEILNPEGINCLRFFFGRGYRVWGARTASSDPEWKYVNVRRYFIYLEQSIDRGTQWAVFEPNGERLWANIRSTISDFLYNEWVSGALLGSSREEAFFVKCDRSTMTQNDLDNGRLICLIGVAALKPAEFVIFRIGQKTADVRS